MRFALAALSCWLAAGTALACTIIKPDPVAWRADLSETFKESDFVRLARVSAWVNDPNSGTCDVGPYVPPPHPTVAKTTLVEPCWSASVTFATVEGFKGRPKGTLIVPLNDARRRFLSKQETPPVDSSQLATEPRWDDDGFYYSRFSLNFIDPCPSMHFYNATSLYVLFSRKRVVYAVPVSGEASPLVQELRRLTALQNGSEGN